MAYQCRAYWVGVLFLGLTACGGRESLAPVYESRWREGNGQATSYIVKRGDTLYSIAFRYDRDYRELAEANHIYSPYTVKVGQIIRFDPYNKKSSALPRTNFYRSQKPPTHQPTPPKTRIHPFYAQGHYKQGWLWPAHGRVVANFVPTQGKKGIDIAGQKGEKIYAASNGVVAYAGSGLTGYGNLIIIKHDNQFLTAYGNNSRNLVSEGQVIKAGQVIADMGVVDRRYWGVHFEIRQAGKPVNPINYLRGHP
jgi:lipoprotein NlpD